MRATVQVRDQRARVEKRAVEVDDIESAPAGERSSRLRRRVRAVREWREGIRHRPAANGTYRLAIGVFGGLVLIAGLVMIPYPGPGWLVVFAGLGILATEFVWAHRVNQWVAHYYRRWTHWLGRQGWFVRLLVLVATAAIVVATLWLLGAFALVAGWFGLHWPILSSPVFNG